MPLKYINTVDGMKLEDCFGFVEAFVTAPDNIKIPLLIYKSPNGEMIHPTGVFRGIWFSEELKAVKLHGYKIEVIKAHNFSKAYLFNDYVDFFYDLKKNANNNIEKTIAKMNLNFLYGMFGRKTENLRTIICNQADIAPIWINHIIKTIAKLDDDQVMTLIHDNIYFESINKLNEGLDTNLLQQVPNKVNSNVAIAAAITSYARIHMMKIKTLPNV